jgi:hypothetical protein
MADAFDDRRRAAIAHGEALTGAPGHEQAAAGGAVERRVADEHGIRGHSDGRANGNGSAVKSFADAVVCSAVDGDVEAGHAERAERLASDAREMNVHGRA